MREPTLNEQATLADVAGRFGNISPVKLWEMYLQVMESNFEQDLWDIAKENLEELKELSKGDK